MATRTVDESDGKRKREEEREEARREVDAAMARLARAELACSGTGAESAALLDRRLRSAALESARRGLRAQLAPARAAARHRRIDDAVGAAPGEPGGFGGELREGGRAAARAVGAELRREAHRARDAGGGRGPGGVAVGACGGSLAGEASKPGRKLCCALDGTGVPALPKETAGRAGKDGGRAGTREAKVGVLWVSETDDEGRPRMVEGAAVLFAGIESAAETPGEESPFERRLLRELAAAGCAPQDVDVCVGDGAEWIRRLFDDWFPDAVGIVDSCHAAEYLWAAARARHDAGGDLAAAWARRLCGMPRRAASTTCWPTCGGGGDVEECRRAAGYLAERRDRMRCDAYLAAGLPIGSGIVEAGCRNVVGRRMKCAGMRWTVAGANPVLWLRCAWLGGWFDHYWDDRVAELAA